MWRWKAIVFDLDDTLYPERDFRQSGFRAVSAWIEQEFALPAHVTLSQFVALDTAGQSPRVFDDWLLRHGSTISADAGSLVRVFREHTPTIHVDAETRSLLEELAGPCRLGLLSDGHFDVQMRKWQALGIAPLFQAVVFSDAFGRDFWKPHPRPFQEVLRQLGVAPHEAVYVGDNPRKDFLGCNALGMESIWFRPPDRLHSQQSPPAAAYAASREALSLPELRCVLQSR